MEEVGYNQPIAETADTIKENSQLKAKTLQSFLGRRSETCVIADDSGLEVKALAGALGVRSARYAGEAASDSENVMKLLREMEPVNDRRARFVTVITLLEGAEQHFFEGEITGTIAQAPRGHNGFGYDPVFIPDGYRTTFAELDAAEKNRISHRAKAMERLLTHLRG
jgi:XTP/dITP diphosphohydrolase